MTPRIYRRLRRILERCESTLFFGSFTCAAIFAVGVINPSAFNVSIVTLASSLVLAALFGLFSSVASFQKAPFFLKGKRGAKLYAQIFEKEALAEAAQINLMVVAFFVLLVGVIAFIASY